MINNISTTKELPLNFVTSVCDLIVKIQERLNKNDYSFDSREELTIIITHCLCATNGYNIAPLIDIFKTKGLHINRIRKSIIGFEQLLSEQVDSYTIFDYTYADYEITKSLNGFLDKLCGKRFVKRERPDESIYEEKYPFDAKMYDYGLLWHNIRASH